MNNYIETPTVGEILKEEFMVPLNLSSYKLAIHVPVSRIQAILNSGRKDYSRYFRKTCTLFRCLRQVFS